MANSDAVVVDLDEMGTKSLMLRSLMKMGSLVDCVLGLLAGYVLKEWAYGGWYTCLLSLLSLLLFFRMLNQALCVMLYSRD